MGKINCLAFFIVFIFAFSIFGQDSLYFDHKGNKLFVYRLAEEVACDSLIPMSTAKEVYSNRPDTFFLKKFYFLDTSFSLSRFGYKTILTIHKNDVSYQKKAIHSNKSAAILPVIEKININFFTSLIWFGFISFIIGAVLSVFNSMRPKVYITLIFLSFILGLSGNVLAAAGCMLYIETHLSETLILIAFQTILYFIISAATFTVIRLWFPFRQKEE
jgi:hypothetical protein